MRKCRRHPAANRPPRLDDLLPLRTTTSHIACFLNSKYIKTPCSVATEGAYEVVPSDSEEEDDESLVLQNSTHTYFTALPESTSTWPPPPFNAFFPSRFLCLWTQAVWTAPDARQAGAGVVPQQQVAGQEGYDIFCPGEEGQSDDDQEQGGRKEGIARSPVPPPQGGNAYNVSVSVDGAGVYSNSYEEIGTQLTTSPSVHPALTAHSLYTHSTVHAYKARCAIAQGNLHTAVAAGSLGRQERGGEEDSEEEKEDRQPVRTRTFASHPAAT